MGRWVGGWVGCYDQLCCPASPKLLLGLDLGQGCDNLNQTTNPECSEFIEEGSGTNHI